MRWTAVHDKSEHRTAIAGHGQIVEAANRFTLDGGFLAGENDVNVGLDYSVRAHVRHPDHQAVHAVARTDDRIAAEPDARRGAREFEKTRPVISASASNPVSASMETRMFENSVTGTILP